MEREFLLGFIKIHILYHASKDAVYGAWLMEELARHGYRLSPGTIYPVLHGLEGKGYLESRKELAGGRVRRLYTLTPEGGRALALAKEKVEELVEEVLLEKED